jgi:hypothetical protein
VPWSTRDEQRPPQEPALDGPDCEPALVLHLVVRLATEHVDHVPGELSRHVQLAGDRRVVGGREVALLDLHEASRAEEARIAGAQPAVGRPGLERSSGLCCGQTWRGEDRRERCSSPLAERTERRSERRQLGTQAAQDVGVDRRIEGSRSQREHLTACRQGPGPAAQAFPGCAASRGDESLDGHIGESHEAAGLARQVQTGPALTAADIQEPLTRAETEQRGKLIDLGERRVAVGTEVAPERPQLDLTSNPMLAHGVRLPGLVDALLVRARLSSRSAAGARLHRIGSKSVEVEAITNLLGSGVTTRLRRASDQRHCNTRAAEFVPYRSTTHERTTGRLRAVLKTSDRAAFQQLARDELARLYALARRLTGRDAEDLVQEARLLHRGRKLFERALWDYAIESGPMNGTAAGRSPPGDRRGPPGVLPPVQVLVRKLDRAGLVDMELAERATLSLDDVALYPLFTDDVLSLKRRLLPDDAGRHIATS